jgi:hypothetical protein
VEAFPSLLAELVEQGGHFVRLSGVRGDNLVFPLSEFLELAAGAFAQLLDQRFVFAESLTDPLADVVGERTRRRGGLVAGNGD